MRLYILCYSISLVTLFHTKYLFLKRVAPQTIFFLVVKTGLSGDVYRPKLRQGPFHYTGTWLGTDSLVFCSLRIDKGSPGTAALLVT